MTRPPKRKRRVRRKWCYAQLPGVYGIDSHFCGTAVLWSEWKAHCWCPLCKIDFIPERNGVFDGPIPLGAANLMGIRFDRINLKTQKLVRQEDYLNGPQDAPSVDRTDNEKVK